MNEAVRFSMVPWFELGTSLSTTSTHPTMDATSEDAGWQRIAKRQHQRRWSDDVESIGLVQAFFGQNTSNRRKVNRKGLEVSKKYTL